MDQALAKEGGAAGCLVAKMFVSNIGIYALLTSAGYLVLGWNNRPVQGNDGAPNASVVWADAFNRSAASHLLDLYRPSDRVQCKNGAFVFLIDDAGQVRDVIASDDYRHWQLVPEPLVGAYVALARATGTLPVPTGSATTTDGVITEPANISAMLNSSTPLELESINWFTKRCAHA